MLYWSLCACSSLTPISNLRTAVAPKSLHHMIESITAFYRHDIWHRAGHMAGINKNKLIGRLIKGHITSPDPYTQNLGGPGRLLINRREHKCDHSSLFSQERQPRGVTSPSHTEGNDTRLSQRISLWPVNSCSLHERKKTQTGLKNER